MTKVFFLFLTLQICALISSTPIPASELLTSRSFLQKRNINVNIQFDHGAVDFINGLSGLSLSQAEYESLLRDELDFAARLAQISTVGLNTELHTPNHGVPQSRAFQAFLGGAGGVPFIPQIQGMHPVVRPFVLAHFRVTDF